MGRLEEGRRRWLRGWRLAALLSLVASLGIVAAFWGDLVVLAFGPPTVTLEESYAEKPGGPTVDHSLLDGLLKRFVDDAGSVDYAGLLAERETLDRYLGVLAAARPDALGRSERLALLINAYNAFTLRLILEHWGRGDLSSIRDIPAADRWEAERWRLGGSVVSLEQIENERIRPHFREPRIHFALVCAARGCPPLRREAFSGERLEAQLQHQALRVHGSSRWLRLDGPILHLTSLYRWYRGDFEQVGGSVTAYAARYFEPLAVLVSVGRQPSIRWLDYDWSLNGQ